MSFSVHLRKNGQYWSSTDRWTRRVMEAREFRSAIDAENFARAAKLAEAEILIHRDGRPPLTIPVRMHGEAN
jgi:hypothetical protein